MRSMLGGSKLDTKSLREKILRDVPDVNSASFWVGNIMILGNL